MDGSLERWRVVRRGKIARFTLEGSKYSMLRNLYSDANTLFLALVLVAPMARWAIRSHRPPTPSSGSIMQI
jgi:hypothetical protein